MVTRKTAHVTGGARGIGRVCARALATAGYDIAIVDLLLPEMEHTARDIALRRLGKPDDIAQVVVFLATSEPCFITGQTFTVDGFQFNC